MGTRIRFERVLAVMGAAALIVFATDALTYAATGSSLLLGKLNSAGTSTTLTNTGSGPALKLITKSSAAAPFTVNGKGKVINLYAARAGLADTATNATNAAKLGGSTLAQVKATSAPRVSNVVWVAKSGGQYTSVKAALASIVDNDATHPYLISVAPGTYNEAGGMELKPYVDIVGAGRDLTTISCACTGVSLGDSAGSVLHGSGDLNSTVSDLTVENTGSAVETGIALSNTTTAALARLAIRVGATDGSTTSAGIANNSASPTIDDVQIVGRGQGPIGVDNVLSNPEMSNIRIDVLSIGGDGFGMRNNTSSPHVVGLSITMAGDANVTGIRVVGSSAPLISEFRIEIGSALVGTGIHAAGGSATVSRGAIVLSTPGGAVTGINAVGSASTFDGILIDVLSSLPAVGVRAEGGTVTIRNSSVTSTASALTLTSTPTVRVTSSSLAGTVDGTGAACAFVADGVGVALDTTCL